MRHYLTNNDNALFHDSETGQHYLAPAGQVGGVSLVFFSTLYFLYKKKVLKFSLHNKNMCFVCPSSNLNFLHISTDKRLLPTTQVLSFLTFLSLYCSYHHASANLRNLCLQRRNTTCCYNGLSFHSIGFFLNYSCITDIPRFHPVRMRFDE